MRMISTVLLLIVSFNIFADYNAEAKACKDSGKVWTNGKGCHVSQELQDVREAARKCKGLEGAALTTCQDEAANKSTRIKHKNDINKGKELIYAGALITSIGTGIAAFKLLKTKCSLPSFWLLLGGSVAVLAGEIISRKKYKKSLDGIKKSYEESTTEANGTEEDIQNNKQLLSFDKLIEIESAREKAEKIRQTTYTIATVAYAGATVSAILEAINPALVGADANCTGNVLKSIKNNKGIDASLYLNLGTVVSHNMIDLKTLALLDSSYTPYVYLDKISVYEFVEINMKKIFNLVVPSAEAQVEKIALKNLRTINKEVLISGNKASKGIGKLYGTASTRAGLAGALGIGAGLLAGQAKNIQQKSQERQKELTDMKNKFAETGGIITGRCTTEMRADSGNPDCYCYLEDGTKDARKGNLKICVDKWAQSSVSKAGNYNTTSNISSNSNVKTCVTKSYESDLGCKCKSNSSCLTVKGNGINFGNGFTWASRVIDTSNAVYSNGLESAAANLSNFENQAATLKKKFDELSKDPKYKPVIAKAKGLEAKLRKSSLNRARKLLASNPGALGGSSFGGNSLSVTGKKTKKETEEKLVAALPPKFSAALKAKKLEDFDFDLGDTDNNTEVLGEDVADTDADYEYNAVLHKNPDASIFKILSNRYMQTGVKNLFEEKLEEDK